MAPPPLKTENVPAAPAMVPPQIKSGAPAPPAAPPVPQAQAPQPVASSGKTPAFLADIASGSAMLKKTAGPVEKQHKGVGKVVDAQPASSSPAMPARAQESVQREEPAAGRGPA